MRVLMFSWEFPPMIAGGLAMACYGMVKSLLKLGVEVDLILPTKELVYFPFRVPSDVDTLPVRYLEDVKNVEYKKLKFTGTTAEIKIQKMNYLGLSQFPETYINASELQKWSTFFEKLFIFSSDITTIEEMVFKNLAFYLAGDEDIFKKVQEMAIRAHKIATGLQYDIIHAHDWLTYAAGIIVKKISKKPLFTHMHATEFDRAGGYGDARIHNIEYDGMSYADRVICVSQYTANMVATRYQVDSAKIRILHNAYTVDEIPNVKQRLFKGPTILFLGRITLQKGPDYFLEVAQKVLKIHPTARFVMAGSGDMAKKLLYKSAKMKLRHRFIFAGFLNRVQVEDILNSIDIYVLPSVSEPFGIAPLEAMAYGATAIISKQSGVSEVVENAYKVDFWDIDEMAKIICYLIKNPQECYAMGQKGKNEVLQIGWDEVAIKLKAYYLELFDRMGN